MTVQPMSNPPSPQPGGGGSFQTMFGGNISDAAANAMQQYGYNSVKKVNGVNVDKYALITRFKQNRSSSDQTQYKKDITLLKTLGYLTTKNPSRAEAGADLPSNKAWYWDTASAASPLPAEGAPSPPLFDPAFALASSCFPIFESGKEDMLFIFKESVTLPIPVNFKVQS